MQGKLINYSRMSYVFYAGITIVEFEKVLNDAEEAVSVEYLMSSSGW